MASINLNRFDLASLRLFVAAVDGGSLTAGAARVGLSVPAASKRLADLEHAVGARLLERGRRGLAPTAAGTTLLAHARRVVGDLEQMALALGDYRGDGATAVRLWVNTSATTGFLPEALARFARAQPGVRIDLEEGLSDAIVRAVQSSAADLGVIGENTVTADLEARVCDRDRLLVVAAADHPLARRRTLRLHDLLDADFVGLERGSALMRLFTREFERRSATLRLRLQLRSFEGICRMVAGGLGLSIMPARAVEPLAPSLGLKLVELREPWARRQLLLVARSFSRLPPPAAALAQHLLHDAEAHAPSKKRITQHSQPTVHTTERSPGRSARYAPR